MIITLFQGIEPKTVATKRSMKSLLGLLGQKRKVESPPKRLRFLSNVSEFSVQPFPYLWRNHMKGIRSPLPQTKGSLLTPQQPLLSQLMKTAPPDPQ
jgi:hypothetical protein